ncbi:hypothetical protein Gohar_018598 [Gossypium harknessii]|uniref:DUF4283 domain-containing protein n=1 Tax=Gossypium harknessii TaxID=34285 RepID=A0A7J9GAB0_9ROSI|nr:hypothetical protein [Gossypium harknessii]
MVLNKVIDYIKRDYNISHVTIQIERQCESMAQDSLIKDSKRKMMDMEDELANLKLADEEDDLVKALTNSVVHFPSLRNVFAEFWHPIEGVTISEIEDKRIFFRFYNELDLNRVINGIPWFFNRHLVLFHRLRKGEDPIQVPLFNTSFWVQIHNLPLGCMSEGMTRQLGNFVGDFMDYVAIIVTRGIKKFMKIQVRLDVRNPLRRRK